MFETKKKFYLNNGLDGLIQYTMKKPDYKFDKMILLFIQIKWKNIM